MKTNEDKEKRERFQAVSTYETSVNVDQTTLRNIFKKQTHSG